MPAEHTDAALLTLTRQWRRKHPRAVVWYRGDDNHKPPSDHLPDKAHSIDAGDYMPGTGDGQPDMDDLWDLARQLVASRDPRISYLIIGKTIVSSTIRPWEPRTYTGAEHKHLHVSVNDRRPNDPTEWKVTLMTPDERKQLIADTAEATAKAVHERSIDRPEGRAKLSTILAYLGSRETIARRVEALLSPRFTALESRLAEVEAAAARPACCHAPDGGNHPGAVS